ncbi:hypothetical protein GWK47_029116 [Chionoecetes opilio]|uniref:Uncharacterized protein n=1 Tax=Chionoecetes opilio TaxID=41210 RepID=A0A8J4YKU3_CHIOP|nr:hypothetical protein GWK47_029116 [Chionoecetes opilio]
MVWLDLHTEEQVGETEKSHSLPGMVLRHQSLLQEANASSFSLLAVSLVAKELYEVLDVSHSISARNPRRTTITESFEDSNAQRPEEEAEAGFTKTSFEDNLVDMMGQANQRRRFVRVLAHPNASTLHQARFESRGVETEGDDLSLTPASSTSFQDHCSHVSASRIRACRDPKKEFGVIFPCEEDGDAVLRIRREGREEFSVPMQDNSQDLVPQFTIFSGGCSLPAIHARWTVLLETAILQCPFQRTER